MSKILDGLEGVLCQMDDVLIYGKDQEEHDRRLSATLNRIREAGVTFNYARCDFSKPQMPFLGQLLSKDGIQADPAKLQAIEHNANPYQRHRSTAILGHGKPTRQVLPTPCGGHKATERSPQQDEPVAVTPKFGWGLFSVLVEEVAESGHITVAHGLSNL